MLLRRVSSLPLVFLFCRQLSWQFSVQSFLLQAMVLAPEFKTFTVSRKKERKYTEKAVIIAPVQVLHLPMSL